MSNQSELGTLKSLWTDSYNGQKAHFVNNAVLAYTCGYTIKFLNIETKETTAFVPPHTKVDNGINGITLLTASAANSKFAYSETQLSPNVYIYDYGSSIKEQAKLIDGATIEYLAIEFSNSEAILTLAGIPDLQITIWNWKNGERIGNISLSSTMGVPEFICFSPTNWRHVTVAYQHEINLWKLEQCDTYKIKTSNQRLLLPPLNENYEEEKVGPEYKDEYTYPNSVIAKLDDKYANVIDEILDKREKHSFKSLCWSNVDEFLVSTGKNHIFRYTVGDSSMRSVYQSDSDQNKENWNCNIIKILLHKQGLFVSCDDGKIRVLEGSDLLSINRKKDPSTAKSISIKKVIDTSSKYISNLCFNLKHTFLSISTNNGVQIFDCGKIHNENDNKLEIIANYDFGQTIAVSSLNPYGEYFVVLKESGTIQTWSIKQAKLVSRLPINEPCTYMTSHPNMPLVVVGTASGSLIFLDYTEAKYPRILENCLIHKKKFKKLKFNSSGTLLFSVTDENKLFVIDTRLSANTSKVLMNMDQRLRTSLGVKPSSFEPGFYLLGYTEFEGEPICLDVIDYIEETSGDKSVTTRCVVGLHDPSSWEATRKTLNDVSTSNDPKASANVGASALNLLQTSQIHPVISRFDYVNSPLPPNYYYDNNSNQVKLASKILVFDINFSIFSDLSKVYVSKKLDFKDDIINKGIFHTHYLFSDLVMTGRQYLLTFSDRFLTKFTVPDLESNKKTPNRMIFLELNEIAGSHDFGYGCLTRSNNGQLVMSGGYDGSVVIRKSIDLKPFTEVKASHFTSGGVQMVRFHNDVVSLLVVGHDGLISCINWSASDSAMRCVRHAAIEGDVDKSQLTKLNVNELKSPRASNEQSWFEVTETQFFKEQDAQYLPIKKEILAGLEDIKKKLKELMTTNEGREELAKLKEHEFYLDLEELDRLHKEADNEILKIREQNELDNLSKLFIREQIKKECWDEMKVKGRGIQAFNSNLLCENYPLRERSKEELQFLERMKLIRRIEIMAQKTRSELTSEMMKRENINELAEIEEEESKDGDNTSNNNNQNTANNYLSPNLVQLSFKGSIGPLFNGDSNLFYHQFELYTREQKWIQIALIQDAIFRIKENFNKEFEQVMQRKNQEIAKIKEKNQRLKQIYIDLNDDKQLGEPQFGDSENPELLFDVKDDEIKVEKYLTAEQRRLLEEQLAEEARKRELEKLDNWRERGLMDMMGGVLQIRREDELKKDIPVPPFVKEKPQEEWTADEQKQYQVYEQKVKELNEERDKLRKQLNAEINKINEQILEYYQSFDNVLLGLHQRKVKTQQAIFQEELKIVRHLNSLIVDSELESYEQQINRKLEKLKDHKKELTQEIQQIRKACEAFKDEYERLLAEDKSQDKAFSREFPDVPAGIREQLLKLFKKRAKQRAPLNKTNLNPNPIFIPELGQDNPFSDRPSTAQQINVYETDTELTLADLDDYDNAPSVDRSVWERFVAYRRQKIAFENDLKLKGLALAEINQYLQKRIEEDEQKRKEIDECNRHALSIQELRLKAFHNLQIQLLMKQGQVEINPGAYVHNLENALLINRNVVESLNKVIQAHGKQKITIMVDSKDYRKGIRQLEWEHSKMKMTIEDYIQKQRDITYLKLTREVQEYLNSADFEGKKQKEISILEQTLAYQAKNYDKIYNLKNKKLNEIKKDSVKIANDNDKYDDTLRDKNVLLHDRKHINEEMTGKSIDIIREEKFQQIIQRRKLVDLAKAQAQEVAFLRSEVERLRMKTFPALVQIEF